MLKSALTLFAGAVSLLALSASGDAAPARKPARAAAPPVTTQLPRTVRPSHYAIRLALPDREKLSFAASVDIDIDVLSATKSITLNAAELAISKAILTSVAAPSAGQSARVALDAAAQTATLSFARPLAPGKYKLSLSYTGKIYQQATGLFALDYKDTKGVNRRALFTQFEAPDARRFVPSWDEPNYKATFDLTTVVAEGEMAVSNMPITRQRKLEGTGQNEVTFQRTPRMSTYLLFLGMGDFERITKKVGPTEVGVVMGRGNTAKAQYALDASAKLVAYFNDYFGTPYPLPKLDNVAGPGQSQFFSAMENWGAIFTFERVLLDDPAITSTRGKQRIFATAGHEIAHQWFGNLVTMQWWDDLWLNEGFASWMESKVTAHFNPEWQAELDRVNGREGAMGLDAIETTHPVIQQIKTVEQTSQAFDSITYSKGEAVITMLEGFAGETIWRDGIRSYMRTYAYKNTRTDDLWRSVEQAGARGLTQIAHDFTKQPGIPLIRVTKASCENGRTTLTLNQGEFSRDRKAKTDAAPLRWNVPVIAQTLGNASARTVVRGGAGSLTVAGCGPLIVNAGQSGYYRTLYAPDMVPALKANLAKMAPIDQLGLLNDSLQLAYGAYQDMDVPLDLASAVSADANAQIVEDTIDTWSGLYARFKDKPDVQAKIAARVSSQFGARLEKLGFKPIKGEIAPEANLRNGMIGALGAMGDPRVLAEARRLFSALDSDPKALDGPMRTTWLSIIAYHASKEDWDKIRRLGQTAPTEQIKSNMYMLLGRAKDKALAQAALDLALTDEPGKTTSAGIISVVAGEHPDMAFDFALANREKVEAMLDVSSISEFFPGLGSGSRDPAMIGKIEAYATKYLTPDSRKPADQSINFLRTRFMSEPRIKVGVEAWMARNS